MPDELRLLAAVTLALIGVATTVPLAIRLARRTAFLDFPAPDGHKGHALPTPYLGGAAVVVAFLVPALALGGGASEYAAIVLGATALLVIGTIDDRVGIGPLPRVLVEAGLAAVLWKSGLGWSVFDSEAANLVLTLFWVVGLVNAFNLMDNMDGAAGTVAAVSATAVAIVAVTQDHLLLAALLLALVGACAGFLSHNLASPARIFLGDGGSMPVGFVIAAGAMVVGSDQAFGAEAVLAAAPLVGLPILDTTFVVVSRRRRGVQILSGGHDHVTFRLKARLKSVRRVAAALATTQAALCALGIALFDASPEVILGAGLFYLLSGAALIWKLEPDPAQEPDPEDKRESEQEGEGEGEGEHERERVREREHQREPVEEPVF